MPDNDIIIPIVVGVFTLSGGIVNAWVTSFIEERKNAKVRAEARRKEHQDYLINVMTALINSQAEIHSYTNTKSEDNQLSSSTALMKTHAIMISIDDDKVREIIRSTEHVLGHNCQDAARLVITHLGTLINESISKKD